MLSSVYRVALVVAVACLAAAALRLGMWLPNVTAVGALALYCGSRLRPSVAWLPPLTVMAATDWLLHLWFGYPPFSGVVYGCFVAEVLLGRLLVRRPNALAVATASCAGATLFYLVTNFAVWYAASEATYPKTAVGLLACYTAGLPFYGYTLLGNLTFSAAFFGADAALAPAASPAPEAEG